MAGKKGPKNTQFVQNMLVFLAEIGLKSERSKRVRSDLSKTRAVYDLLTTDTNQVIIEGLTYPEVLIFTNGYHFAKNGVDLSSNQEVVHQAPEELLSQPEQTNVTDPTPEVNAPVVKTSKKKVKKVQDELTTSEDPAIAA